MAVAPLLTGDETQFRVWFHADILQRCVLLLMIMGRRALIGLSAVTDVLYPSCRSPLGCNICLRLLVASRPPSSCDWAAERQPSQLGPSLSVASASGGRLGAGDEAIIYNCHTSRESVATAKRLLIKVPLLCFFCLWFPQSLSQTGGFQELRLIGCGRKPLAAGDESRGCTSQCEL